MPRDVQREFLLRLGDGVDGGMPVLLSMRQSIQNRDAKHSQIEVQRGSYHRVALKFLCLDNKSSHEESPVEACL